MNTFSQIHKIVKMIIDQIKAALPGIEVIDIMDLSVSNIKSILSNSGNFVTVEYLGSKFTKDTFKIDRTDSFDAEFQVTINSRVENTSGLGVYECLEICRGALFNWPTYDMDLLGSSSISQTESVTATSTPTYKKVTASQTNNKIPALPYLLRNTGPISFSLEQCMLSVLTNRYDPFPDLKRGYFRFTLPLVAIPIPTDSSSKNLTQVSYQETIWYDLSLMSDIQGNHELAKLGKIYVSNDGQRYVVRDPNGVVQQGTLPGNPRFDMNNLASEINNPTFKKFVLDVTSKRGHTQTIVTANQ